MTSYCLEGPTSVLTDLGIKADTVKMKICLLPKKPSLTEGRDPSMYGQEESLVQVTAVIPHW